MWKKRLVMALFILLSGILMGRYGGAASYLMFYTAVTLPLLSAGYVVYVYFRFRIYQKIEHRTVVKGERIPYEFILANEDVITYAYVNVDFLKGNSHLESLALEKSYCLLPGEKISKSTVLCCHYRGNYQVGIDHAVIRDFLGLISITYPIGTKIEMEVLPKVVPLERFRYAPGNPDEKGQPASFTGRPEIPDVETREYMPGDSMHSIHFKASARQGALMSRKYMDEPKPELFIVPNLKKTAGGESVTIPVEDKVIEVFLSIGNYFYQSHTQWKAFLWEEEARLIKVAGGEDMDELYHYCAETKFMQKAELVVLLEAALRFIKAGDKLMLITSTLSKEFAQLCYRFPWLSEAVTCFYIEGPHSEPDLEFISLLENRITLVRIPVDMDIKKYLEEDG